MTTVLIVDDSVVDRKLAGSCLRDSELQLEFAANGREALDRIRQNPPDLVVTDLKMPEVDGLELVQQIKSSWKSLPVILMTAFGSEEVAVAALSAGAASYVPKKNLGRDLEETVLSVLSVSLNEQAEQQALETLTGAELSFEIGNDLSSLRPLITRIQDQLRQLQVCDESEIIRISTALQEALVNAIEHGNLELDSKLREDRGDAYARLGQERRHQEPYCNRRVRLTSEIDRNRACWRVSDDGSGFDPGSLPDPTDPANLQKVSGRGLLLIRTFMDEVTFNATANEITMIKRRSLAGSTENHSAFGRC